MRINHNTTTRILSTAILGVMTLFALASPVCDTVEKRISSGCYSLILKQSHDGFHLSLLNGDEETYYQESPAQITVRGNDTLSDGNYEETEYAQPYCKVIKNRNGLQATAKVATKCGAVFIIKDKYTILKKGAFGLSRIVEVDRAKDDGKGFASTFSLKTKLHSSTHTDYEYFIPSILYRNTLEMRTGAIAADLNVARMYVKETRTGLPLAMVREKKSGHTLTLIHHKPSINIGQHPGGGAPGEINNELQYGSIGYTLQPTLSVDFRYPCAEGPRTYDTKQKRTDTAFVWSNKYHQLQTGSKHSYYIALIPDKTTDYNQAMVYSFGTAFSIEAPRIIDMDMDEIYQQNIKLFQAEYREFGTGSVVAAGLPWSLDLPDGTNTEGVSFQMGFVGQQIAVGYHLYRYGLDNKDSETRRKGKTMVDFWMSDAIMGSYFPTVW